MEKEKRKYIVGFLGVLILVLLDQLSKLWAIRTLRMKEPIVIIKDVFELFYLENTGAAFGIMEHKTWFFIILTMIVLAFILYFYIKTPNTSRYFILRVIMIMIISGAIGNLMDRIRYNYVVDFLYFKLIDFPVFNIADCYVTISTILAAVFVLFVYKEEELSIYYRKKKEI